MYIHSDRLTSLSQSTALGIYAGRVLKARCASYAQGLALHALCLVTKTCHDVVIRKTDEHQNHLYMLCEALCDAHPVIRNTGVSIQMCIICSVWHIQMLVDFFNI